LQAANRLACNIRLEIAPEAIMGVRIVLADDNETVRHLIRTLLQTRSEWQVVAEAADGREAIEKTRELKPDVVILDFRMPGVNGIDATKVIVKELPATAVIVLTVHNSKALMRLALGAGARCCMVKSEVSQQLVEVIESVITPQKTRAPHKNRRD
jgi:DNA-binding NarL/FixJ family response regulator